MWGKEEISNASEIAQSKFESLARTSQPKSVRDSLIEQREILSSRIEDSKLKIKLLQVQLVNENRELTVNSEKLVKIQQELAALPSMEIDEIRSKAKSLHSRASKLYSWAVNSAPELAADVLRDSMEVDILLKADSPTWSRIITALAQLENSCLSIERVKPQKME